MKRKYIAAVCAALGSTAAFAAPLPTDTGVPAGLVTYYIAGASAQQQAVAAVLPTADFFATPADVVKLTGGSTTDARYGMSNAAVTGGVSKPLLVVYRNSNGSGSGMRQLVSVTNADIAALPNVGTTVIKNDNLGLVTLATCGAVTGSSGAYTAACTSTEARVPDVALSDMAPVQLAGDFPSGAGYVSVDSLITSKNALQGFGIYANPAAYLALQKQNIAEGTLATSCSGDASIACQPSIRKDDYASLISAEGSIKDSATLFNGAAGVAADEVVVCRRTNASGTQATSNTFFLNNKCGTVGFQGSYNPVGAEDSSPGTIVWSENSASADVKTCLSSTAGYRLGVLSLENPDASGYKVVKLDGVSPNNTYNGSAVALDTKFRQQFASGAYPYAFEMFSAIKPTAPSNVVAFFNSLNAKLGDSTKSDLVGIAYLDNQAGYTKNSTANKQSRVSRQGNNCGPLLP